MFEFVMPEAELCLPTMKFNVLRITLQLRSESSSVDLGVDGGEDEKDHEGAGDRFDASSERNKDLAHWFQLLEEPHDAEGPEHS